MKVRQQLLVTDVSASSVDRRYADGGVIEEAYLLIRRES